MNAKFVVMNPEGNDCSTQNISTLPTYILNQLESCLHPVLRMIVFRSLSLPQWVSLKLDNLNKMCHTQ